MTTNGRTLHGKAAQARETGNFTASLDFNDQALFAYDVDDDSLGFAEGIACRAITLRVYANLHQSKRILMLVKYELLAAVSIAKSSNRKEALAFPLFHLAQTQEDLDEISEALTSYKEAIAYMKNNPPLQHNRSSVLINMLIHYYICEYKAGNKTFLQKAIEAVSQLASSDEPTKFNKHVWMSGAYMRIAIAMKDNNRQKANEYMQKAKTIIESDPELILRQKQWEKLNTRYFL